MKSTPNVLICRRNVVSTDECGNPWLFSQFAIELGRRIEYSP
jgi:hypothetical protein